MYHSGKDLVQRVTSPLLTLDCVLHVSSLLWGRAYDVCSACTLAAGDWGGNYLGGLGDSAVCFMATMFRGGLYGIWRSRHV